MPRKNYLCQQTHIRQCSQFVLDSRNCGNKFGRNLRSQKTSESQKVCFRFYDQLDSYFPGHHENGTPDNFYSGGTTRSPEVRSPKKKKKKNSELGTPGTPISGSRISGSPGSPDLKKFDGGRMKLHFVAYVFIVFIGLIGITSSRLLRRFYLLIYTCTYTHTYIYIYMSIYMYIRVCFKIYRWGQS